MGMTRRSFLAGLVALTAAPAVAKLPEVRAVLWHEVYISYRLDDIPYEIELEALKETLSTFKGELTWIHIIDQHPDHFGDLVGAKIRTPYYDGDEPVVTAENHKLFLDELYDNQVKRLSEWV